MSRLIDEKRQYCKAKMHNVACQCYKLAETEFLATAGKTSFWESYCEGSKKLNFEGTKYLPSPCVFFNIFSGINYPAGLEDVAKFSEQNPEIHIRAHLIYGSSAVNVFVGERTPQQTHNVDICFSEFLNYDNNEITGEKERERERERLHYTQANNILL